MLFWLRHSNISGLNYKFCLKNITKKILKRKEKDASCQNSVKETGLDALLLNSPSNPVPFTYLRHVKENEKFLFPFNIKYEIMPAFLKLLLIVRIEYKIFQTVLYQL